jgi:cell division septal protein FtsQ
MDVTLRPVSYRTPARREPLRYLRRDGNRMVRARRRRRTAARMSVVGLMWAAGAVALASGGIYLLRLAFSPAHFQLARVVVQGAREATNVEIEDLVKESVGSNLLTIDLGGVEKKVRAHPWIGATGSVRIQRRLPSTLIVSFTERTAGGLAMLDGEVWLLDERGMPIDRFGPRYAQYDFPIIRGLDALAGHREALAAALAEGVGVAQRLAAKAPAMASQVSEIDMAHDGMVVLKLEGETYDVRLARGDDLGNLDRFLALKDQIREPGGPDLEYVDLRWRDRIAVMPAAARQDRSAAAGGRGTTKHKGGGR